MCDISFILLPTQRLPTKSVLLINPFNMSEFFYGVQLVLSFGWSLFIGVVVIMEITQGN